MQKQRVLCRIIAWLLVTALVALMTSYLLDGPMNRKGRCSKALERHYMDLDTYTFYIYVQNLFRYLSIFCVLVLRVLFSVACAKRDFLGFLVGKPV